MEDMKDAIANKRLNINSDNLDNLLELNSFKSYCKMLFADTSGTQACMINHYIKNVSSMLALISAERELLPKCFALNHINYSCYLTFQHVNFSEIKHCNESVWKDLLREGFGGSLSGEPLSTILRGLITEVTINREVKVRGGPMMGGYTHRIRQMVHLLS